MYTYIFYLVCKLFGDICTRTYLIYTYDFSAPLVPIQSKEGEIQQNDQTNQRKIDEKR